MFAYGVKTDDDQWVKSPYRRIKQLEVENKWVLSQAILITKFGFYDGHREDTYDIL